MALAELGRKLTTALSRLNRKVGVDEELLDGVVKDVCRALLESDVAAKLVVELRKTVTARVKLEDAPGMNTARIVERAVLDALIAILDPGKTPYKMVKGRPNIVMFVGLQGAGKTTTVAKYAHYFKTRKWKTAMVCADTFRAGAFDQLRQNAQKLHVPYYGSYTEPDPVKIAAAGVDLFKREGFEVIIVDTSGRHKQEAALFDEMEDVAAAVHPDEIIFVMDSSIGQSAFAQASAFKESVPIGSVIITKLDGHARGGGALSAVAATGSPITFIGTGEHFDDLDPFEPRAFVSKLLGRGDMKGLVERFKEAVDEKDMERMMKRMQKGEFTLRDMYEQFQSILKLGPLNKVLSQLPMGLGPIFDNLPAGMDGGERIRKFMVILDSMTDEELECDVTIDLSRARRIARGSGAQLQEILMLLKMHRQFEKMVGKMGKSFLMKGNEAALGKMMQRNPKAFREQLMKSMDPMMLQQVGGVDAMMNMMKQFNGKDMSQLSDMLGGGGGGGGGGLPAALAGMMGGGGGGGGAGGGGRGGGARGGGRGGGGMPAGFPGLPPGMAMPPGMPGGAGGMADMLAALGGGGGGGGMGGLASMLSGMLGGGGGPPPGMPARGIPGVKVRRR